MCEICQAGDSSFSTRRGGALAVWCVLWGVIALSAQPCTLLCSHITGGRGLRVFFPNLTLTVFAFTDAHSLSYNFTIDLQPRDGQPWCEVQGEVDQKVFLSYDCGRAKIKYMSPLGEEVKSMNAWETQTEALRGIGALLRKQMPNVTLEKLIDKGELESLNAGGVDWGLSCIHCFRVKKKIGYCPSLVVQWKEQLLQERLGPD